MGVPCQWMCFRCCMPCPKYSGSPPRWAVCPDLVRVVAACCLLLLLLLLDGTRRRFYSIRQYYIYYLQSTPPARPRATFQRSGVLFCSFAYVHCDLSLALRLRLRENSRTPQSFSVQAAAAVCLSLCAPCAGHMRYICAMWSLTPFPP